MTEWPLVGRTHELDLVERAFRRLDAVGVVLAGAAGVGKTRLARTLLERAAASGRTTAWAQATPAAAGIPFGAFAHLLPAQLSEAGPFNLLRVAGDAIADRSPDGHIVLGIDDAHLLDASSVALLGHLAASGTCFVIATIRSHEPVPDAIVRLWRDGPLERVELETLSAEEVTTLLRAVLGHVDAATRHRLWQASRGNPLFLRELLNGGVAAGSLIHDGGVWRWRNPSLATVGLTELVEARLADVSSEQRKLLEVIAQAEPLEAAFVDALGAGPDIESLERRGLLEIVVSDRRRTMRLAHPLYTEALRASTPASTIPVAFRRLAELLTATGVRRTGDDLRLATWRLAAEDLTDTALFVTAGHQAVMMLDFGLAERLARAALAADDDGFEARFVLAAAYVGRGRYAEAESLFADLEDRATNDAQRARAALRRNDNLYGPLGRPDDAVAVLERALADVTTTPWRDALLGAKARLRLFGGNAIEAVTEVEALLGDGTPSPEVAAEISAVVTWGCIIAGRPEALEAHTDRLLGAPLLPSAHYASFGPHLVAMNQMTAAAVLGHLRAAEQIGGDAHHRSATAGSDVQRAVTGFAYGWVLRVIGRPRAASEVLIDSVGVLRAIDLYRMHGPALAEMAYCWATLGDVGAAEATLDAAEAAAAHVPSFVMDDFYVAGAKAWVAAARGERSAARQLIRECAETCRSHGQLTFEAFAWHDLARLGDAPAAEDALRALTSRVDGELIPAFADHATALAAGDALALGQVSDRFERMGAALYAAEAAASSAQVHRRQGRTGSALTAAARARHLADGCEGARTPALDAVDGSLPLTAREHEIAGLAARGLSNREIADRLVLSVRTVDNHLHNTYAKLGITQRADLAPLLFPGAVNGHRV